MADILNYNDRVQALDEIKGQENTLRKRESLKRFEVFKDRAGKFVIDKLESEFSHKTVSEMRKILSINLCPRIINELSSIYAEAPEREFKNVTEEQENLLEKLYEMARVDVQMQNANKYFKLYDQIILKVIPWEGVPGPRAILPHQIDVIPKETNPEVADSYIISVFNKYLELSSNISQGLAGVGRNLLNPNSSSDGVNQSIADKDDYKIKERYECWSETANFFMNGKGEVVSEDTINVIGELPFVDISCEKDFEFWVRNGNGIVDFAIDFMSQLSDVSNLLRLQGYAQAIFTGTKQPENMLIGPNRVLFMQVDENNPQVVPRFEFASPNSDIGSSLNFLEMTLRMFLTSKGIDPKAIASSNNGAQSFSSALERLLSMVSRFEASQADMKYFESAEEKIFKLMVKWLNAYQGTDKLHPDLRGPLIPENAEMVVVYKKPQEVQTEQEKQAYVKSLLDMGVMSKVEAVEELYGIDEQMAIEKMKKIEAESKLTVVQLPAQHDEPAVDEMQPSAQIEVQ
jgi:hypothetical protein